MTASPPQTLYFGYGSNLWLEQMARRCPESRFVGRAVLHNFRWQINQRGYANVVPDPENVIEGLCYLLSRSDEVTLDRAEGVPISYEKIYREVEFFGTGGEDTYTTAGQPKAEYVVRINRGVRDAIALGFSRGYVDTKIRPLMIIL
ncbi:hypothetical protein BDD12DRAFT_945227 [Trichophaea hybrida]|nr:hypothetical protein BDD12DRAFT_945227 [Trichophaea hybrida]